MHAHNSLMKVSSCYYSRQDAVFQQYIINIKYKKIQEET